MAQHALRLGVLRSARITRSGPQHHHRRRVSAPFALARAVRRPTAPSPHTLTPHPSSRAHAHPAHTTRETGAYTERACRCWVLHVVRGEWAWPAAAPAGEEGEARSAQLVRLAGCGKSWRGCWFVIRADRPVDPDCRSQHDRPAVAESLAGDGHSGMVNGVARDPYSIPERCLAAGNCTLVHNYYYTASPLPLPPLHERTTFPDQKRVSPFGASSETTHKYL
ncbi:hypothetical protein EDB86DRAFT_2829396 [Lactarius hatsudake]|nr:hypothetical protein EDB86DRAFT_2829396 [Lactarius hatsudake]